MNEQHIVSAYDRDLEAIQAMLMQMGGLVESAILNAAEALVNLDEDMAARVREEDARIDALEERINAECARVIATRQPIAADLRTVLTVMKISTNLERIGDYAKNLGKRTQILIGMAPTGSSSKSLRRMAREVEVMLKNALDAYMRRDARLALQVRDHDIEVDQIYNALFRELLTHMMEDPRNISPCMHLHFIAKNIERMGDHTTSIAEEVIYLVTGERPEDPRPKDTRLFQDEAE